MSTPHLAPAQPVSLSALDRYQPLLLIMTIGAGLALAELSPGLAGALSPAVTGGVLVLIYLVMLGVEASGVTGAFRERRFLVTAVVVNFVVNPLAAWLLAEVFLSGHPDLRVGLILFLVTPCIGWYLIFTELAGGDAELGVCLLGVNLVLQVLLLPLYLYLFAGEAAAIDIVRLLGSVLLFLVLPAAAAVATRAALRSDPQRLGQLRDGIDRTYLKTIALVVVIVAMFGSQADVLLDNPSVVLTLLPPMLLFFAFAFGVALVGGRLVGLPHPQRALLAFTATSRNSEASLAIAATAFSSPLVGLTVVIGPVIELPLLVLMVRVLLAQADPAAAPVGVGDHPAPTVVPSPNP